MKSHIKFAEEKLKETLVKLKTSKTEDQKLYKWINRALDDIEEDAFCATQVPKKLIPKIYIENNMKLIIYGSMIYQVGGDFFIRLQIMT